MTFALAWNGRRRLVAVRLFCRSCAQAGMFFRVPLSLSTAVWPPHCTENEACCVYLNAVVKQPSMRSLPYIPAAAAAKNRLCMLALRQSLPHTDQFISSGSKLMDRYRPLSWGDP